MISSYISPKIVPTAQHIAVNAPIRYPSLYVKECESILALLLVGKYTAGPGVNPEQLKQIDWNKPGGFWKRGDRLSLQFPHKRKGSGFFELKVKPGKKQLVITQLLQAVP